MHNLECSLLIEGLRDTHTESCSRLPRNIHAGLLDRHVTYLLFTAACCVTVVIWESHSLGAAFHARYLLQIMLMSGGCTQQILRVFAPPLQAHKLSTSRPNHIEYMHIRVD